MLHYLFIILFILVMPISLLAQDENPVLWQDNFDDEDPTASKNVGWFYYGEGDGLVGSVVEQRSGELYMKEGSFSVIGAVVAGTNGVPEIILDEDGDPTDATKEAVKQNNYSSPNQELTFQFNNTKNNGSFFIVSTRMTIDDDSLDSDPTESAGYVLFVSPLQGMVGIGNYPAEEFKLLDPTGYNYLAPMASFPFELNVYYWAKLYLNEGDMKVKFWEGDLSDEPEEWLIEAVDPEPRVTGQFTYFGLFNPDPNATDEIYIDNVTMHGIGATAVAGKPINVPVEFALNQNFPNPFNPTTDISYNLAKNSHVTLSVYNANGQKVANLVDARQSQGLHRITWNGKNDRGQHMTSGVYFVRMEAEGFSQTIKTILMK